MGADPNRFSERLGKGAPQDAGPVVWFHAASLGEVQQIAPLAQEVADRTQTKVLVTTTTATGADWVARHMPYAAHRFAPLDTPAAISSFLNAWSLTAAIFVEGDLWPRLLHGLEQRGVPRILLNARHSNTRARFPAVFAALLGPFSLVTCRSEPIARDMKTLGLAAEKVHVLPDLRLTQPKLAAPEDKTAPLTTAIGTRPLWLAASTHPGDEAAVLTAHQKVLATYPDALLILAPRHPKRRGPICQQAQEKHLTTATRSEAADLTAKTQVYIADTLGELGVFFSLSPLTFLGGSFGDEGGHNPYEPAHFGAAILHGPKVKNFVDAYQALGQAGAAVEVSDPANLGQVVTELLQTDAAESIAKAALAFMQEQQNCTATYANLIIEVLQNRKNSPTA